MTQTARPSILVRNVYHTLFSAWGCQHWWPAQSRLEMVVGAYLTQNTAWANVEKALRNLRAARRLTLDGIRRTPERELAKLIRPSGYFRQKAKRLKTFVRVLDKRYRGSLSRMFRRPVVELRDELLALHGVGPETADSILLYAGNYPVFVVDAYTRRIFERHEIISADATYEEIRALCEDALESPSPSPSLVPYQQTNAGEAPASDVFAGACHRPSRVSRAERSELVQVFNDMHGLLVRVGKNYCLKSQPRCEQCPLQRYLPETK